MEMKKAGGYVAPANNILFALINVVGTVFSSMVANNICTYKNLVQAIRQVNDRGIGNRASLLNNKYVGFTIIVKVAASACMKGKHLIFSSLIVF